MASKKSPKAKTTKEAKAARKPAHAPAKPAPPRSRRSAKPAKAAVLPKGDWAARLAKARSRPVEVEAEGGSQILQVEEEAPAADAAAPAVHAEAQEEAAAAAPAIQVDTAALAAANEGLSLPEQFLLAALRPGWDDRMERVRPGSLGAALVGSLLLELALHGRLRVQRDRFQAVGAPSGDADLDALAQRVRQLSHLPSREAMARLGWRLTDRIRPWKRRLEGKRLAREATRRHLGIFPRSETAVLDPTAQDRLQKRLMRILAGGGVPDAQSVALLALADAAGLLEEMVPSSTLDFNRKRIKALLSGRDTLGYSVHGGLRQVQEACVQAILGNVRQLRGT